MIVLIIAVSHRSNPVAGEWKEEREVVMLTWKKLPEEGMVVEVWGIDFFKLNHELNRTGL